MALFGKHMHICPHLTSVISYIIVLVSAFLGRHSSFVPTVIVCSEKKHASSSIRRLLGSIPNAQAHMSVSNFRIAFHQGYSFNVLHLSFGIHRSSFVIHHAAYCIHHQRHYSFGKQIMSLRRSNGTRLHSENTCLYIRI